MSIEGVSIHFNFRSFKCRPFTSCIHSNVTVTTGVVWLLKVVCLSDKCCSEILDDNSILISDCCDDNYIACRRLIVIREVVGMI